jgi:glycosyltransferase involved in cell wall biosynthesis
MGMIVYYVMVKMNNQNETKFDSIQVRQDNQQIQSSGAETNQTNQDVQPTQNNGINQTNNDAQPAQSSGTNQTIHFIQPALSNETNQTKQEIQQNQTSENNETIQDDQTKHSRQVKIQFKKTLDKKISQESHKKSKFPFYDHLPRIGKKDIKNVKDIFKSNRLYLNDKELTIEFIDFIKPIDRKKEETYKKILFPNLSFYNYTFSHTYHHSHLLLYPKSQPENSKPKKKNNTKSNTKVNSSNINNKNLSVSKNNTGSLINSQNNLNNSIINNTIYPVNNSNDLSNPTLNISVAINANSSIENISNSNNITLPNNITLTNNITTTKNNTNNESHNVRNLVELSQNILKEFYSLCDKQKLLTIKKDKKINYDKPMISIIIPYYNAKLELIKTLRSVQLQTLKNIEIIVVDDNVVSAEKKYKNILDSDFRIRLFSHPKNMGIWRKRIDGFLYSRGKYILHIDPGDILSDIYVLEDLYKLVSK